MKEESLLWMMHHHLASAITLMQLALKNDLIEPDVVEHYLTELSREADTVWEEQLWIKYIQALYYEDHNADNVIRFTPDIRGPDS